MTTAVKNTKSPVTLDLTTAPMPTPTKGTKYVNPFKIKLSVDDGKTLQNFEFLKNTNRGNFEHAVKRGTKIVVKIEGAEVFSANNPTGRKLLLKRIDNDLIFETEAGEKLVQLKDYYLAPDVELDSPNWIEIAGENQNSPLNAAVDYLTGQTTALPLDFLAYYSLGLLGVGAVGGFLLNNKKKTVTTTAAAAANLLKPIADYAAEAAGTSAPTLAIYKAAGITGIVSETDAVQVNSFLANPDIDPTTRAAIEAIANAANKVEAYAANASSPIPVLADYQTLGVFDTTSTPAQTSLLNSVVDNIAGTQVDTFAELNNLASAVKVVQDAADGGNVPTHPALKAALTALGITDVNDGNIAAIAAAVATAGTAGTDTLSELTNIAKQAAQTSSSSGLAAINAYSSDVTGALSPSLDKFQAAGITGVASAADADQVNSFLALADTDPTGIDAVVAVAAAANKVEAFAAIGTNVAPTLVEYQTLGILASTATPAQISLLNSAVDSKLGADVDSATELMALANAVKVVQDAADGGTLPTSTALIAALQTLGMTSANTSNIALISTGLATANTGGSDTIAELSAIAVAAANQAAVNAAQALINAYAADTAGAATPTLANYQAAGVTGLASAADADQVNSFLALADTDPAGKTAVEAVAAAANKVEAYAVSPTNPAPTLTDYQTLGVLASTGTQAQVNLLNNAVEIKAGTDVDSATELMALANAVKVVQDAADGGNLPTNNDLLAALTTLGITGANSTNIAPIAAALAGAGAAGSDTLSELNTLAGTATSQASQDAALLVLTTFAADPSVPVEPSLVHYQAANIAGVDTSVDATQVNSFMALADIDPTNKAAVEAVAAAANKVEAYAVNNTNPLPSLSDYQLLGILPSGTQVQIDLLNSAVDSKTDVNVDTAAELIALAEAVKVVQDAADGGTLPSNSDLLAALTTLGVAGVSLTNIAPIAVALATATVAGADSIAELNAIAAAANQVLQAAAQTIINAYAADTAGAATPTLANYQAAGITGVNSAADTDQVNSFLAMADTDPAGKTAVEAVAAAANKVEAYAVSPTNLAPTLTDYQTLGVLASSGGTQAQATLLNSAVDSKAGTDVDSATELMALANAVKVVQDAADGGNLPTNNDLLAALTTLGIAGVTVANIAEIAREIGTAGTGGADTLSELTNLMATVTSAVPTVSSIVLSATGAQAGTLNIGDTVTATVNMSEVTNVSGTPQLALTIGGSVVQANYVSGSASTALVFSYTIASGRNDSNGISLTANALGLNGGTLTDVTGNNANLSTGALADNANFKVDTTDPTTPSILSVIDSVGNVTTDVAHNGKTDDTALVVRVNLANTGAAAGDSVQLLNGTTNMASPVTLIGTNITAGFVDIATPTLSNGTTYDFNAKITDPAGNVSAAATVNHTVTIDTAPSVSSLAISSATNAQNSTLNQGDVLTVTVNMNEVTTVTGTPQLALNIGGTTVQANYVGGTGTTALTFSYTIAANQTDTNGISLAANALTQSNGSTLRDSFGSDAILDTLVVADNASYKVDTSAPLAPSITSVTDNVGASTGPVATGGTTDDPVLTVRVSLTGTGAAAGDNVQLLNGSTALGTAVSLSADDITRTYVDISTGNTALVAGTYSFNAKITDAAGNVGASSAVSYDVTVQVTNPTPFSLLDGVTNLDVRSNLVLEFTESVTAVATKYIHIVNDVGGGYEGENTIHTFDILVTDTSQVTIAGNRIILNPSFDLDLNNNYHITIDDGAFLGSTSGTSNAAFDGSSSLNFSTVSPGVLRGNTATPLQQSVQAVEMDALGALQNSLKWLDVTGVGSVGQGQNSVGYQNIDASLANFAFVFKDADPLTDDSGDGGAIQAVSPLAVKLNKFDGADLFYIDNQQNQPYADLQTELATMGFAGGDPTITSGSRASPYVLILNDGTNLAFDLDLSVTINTLAVRIDLVVANNNTPWTTTGMVITA